MFGAQGTTNAGKRDIDTLGCQLRFGGAGLKAMLRGFNRLLDFGL